MIPVGETELYSFGGFSNRTALGNGFFRDFNAADRNVPQVYPDGFLPRIDNESEDISVALGVRGDVNESWTYDVNSLINTIKPFQFNGFAGLNTLFVGLCQHPEFKSLDFSKLKLTISGGTALTPAAIKSWKEVTQCEITEGYGLSETSPVVCLNSPGKESYGTVGLPLAGYEVEIRNENNEEVAQGESGEIVTRGPHIMAGYWNKPQETAQVMTADGFFKTGDIGIKLADGSIQIVDRLKDMIIVSGFNVYPNEIEAVLVEHPNILEAAVIGQSDEKTGEKVVCYITTNGELSVNDVVRHCRENLTSYKVPKGISIVTELPKSSVGKILRRELRAI
jgi:long-chain acyl-CoA synthetase